MKPTSNRKTKLRAAFFAVTVACAFALISPSAPAQSSDTKPADSQSADTKPTQNIPTQTETIYLKNVTSTNDLNDAQTALRNVLPRAKIYGIATENAITIRATQEDLETAHKLLAEIDRPKKLYRVTFTITETDSGKALTAQHYAIVVVDGSRSTFKQGNKIPLITGAEDSKDSKSGPVTQFQYIDVGLTIEADIDGVQLHSKVEQSTLSDEKSSVGIQDPIIHQNMLENLAILTPGRQQIIGSLDIAGTTRHQEISVLADLIL